MLLEIWLTELAKQGGEYIFDLGSFVCPLLRRDAVFEL